MSLPAPGFPLSLSRQYDSRAQTPGDFGPGWSLPQAEVSVAITHIIGEGWTQNSGAGLWGMPVHTLAPSQRHLIVIRFSDDDVVRFEPEVSPDSSIIYPFEMISTKVRFSPADGTQGTLKALGVGSEVRYGSGLLTTPDGDVYSPARFEYTRPDGTVYVISTEKGIESMTDVSGNTVIYGENGITHSSGAGIGFERDTSGRIRTVTDEYGRKTEYHYDENGMLTQVTQSDDQSGFAQMLSNCSYSAGTSGSPPVIKEIKAPDGTVLGTFEYDARGRMTGMTDAQGQRIVYGFDVPNHKQEVKDRREHVTKYEYDGEGNVTRKEDPLGNVTAWTYDDDGNKISETNALGHVTTWTYDENGNMLTETDPLGNTTSYVYNERNQVVRKTDSLGNVIEKFYDEKGNLIRKVNPSGGEITYAYDDKGNKISEEDVPGNVTTYGYDDDGNMVMETGPDGSVTEYGHDRNGNGTSVTTRRTGEDGSGIVMTVTKAYDSLNRLTKETDPGGHFTETEYDPVTGKKSLSRDRNGNVTTYGYDDQGNLLTTAYPGGKTISHTYDAEGNALSTTDRGGNTTSYKYDVLNRVTEITHPGGGVIGMEYDAGGLTATVDERGRKTSFEWNAVGKRTKITDASGNVTRIEYDANGNERSVTDAEGNTVIHEYDTLNRRIKTIFPDGTFTSATYHGDSDDRKASETDQAGRMTSFGYDSAGRLKNVTDAKGGVTSFIYDEVGNRLTQTDPNGNTKHWYYDDLGRVVRHRLPQGTAEESYVYDPNGNVLEKTDFNGDTVEYEYDGYNRLTKKSYPDGSEVSFTYTDNGRRKTVTDARGVTQYDYDALNRLKKVTDPDSTEIAYTYDAKGNRTSVTVPSGRTDYAYDDLNRLETVTDPDGGVTSYVYDKVGNRKSVTYPNGIVAEYMYDRLHRLIKLENRNAAGDLISGYIYTLGPAGNREQIEELHSGRVVKYAYDELHRLTAEEITDPVLGNETISYAHDAFGNRLTESGSGGTISYSYNDNDELETEGGLSYGYDDNGNAVSRDGVIFGYDYENRLVSAGSANYAYDADGIRVSSAADGSTTDYLVDKNRQYAQVLEERNGGSSVSYVYGDDLISRKQGGENRYYVYDGHGSVRQLTDATGAVTDSYIYDAFGNLRDHLGGSDNRYLYAGEQYDSASGLYYLRARYYDPESGRFLTHDPYPGRLNEPVTLHRYLYGNANPVMYTDPSGKFALTGLLTGMNLLTRITLIYGLTTQLYSNISHNLSKDKVIRWKGELVLGIRAPTRRIGWARGAVFVHLETRDERSEKVTEGDFALFLPLGIGIGGVSASFSGLTVVSPGLFGPDPDMLQGLALYAAASFTVGPDLRLNGPGPGPGVAKVIMGMGTTEGPLGFAFGYIGGVDSGAEFIAGVSIRIDK